MFQELGKAAQSSIDYSDLQRLKIRRLEVESEIPIIAIFVVELVCTMSAFSRGISSVVMIDPTRGTARLWGWTARVSDFGIVFAIQDIQ